MKIDFEGRTYALHYSFRIGMLYEQIQGKSIDFTNLNQFDIIILFYSTFISTLQYHKVNHHMKLEDFMNWIDDNGGEKMIVDFSNWYIEALRQQYDLVAKKEEGKPEGEPDPNV